MNMVGTEQIQRAIKGGPVDNKVELAAAIGRCSNNWAHAETRLAILFCLLSKTDLTTAVTIFSFFKATQTQSDVLKRLGKLSPIMTPQKLELLNDPMREYRGVAEERNRLLHNPIGMNEDLYIMLRDRSPEAGAIPYKTEANFDRSDRRSIEPHCSFQSEGNDNGSGDQRNNFPILNWFEVVDS